MGFPESGEPSPFWPFSRQHLSYAPSAVSIFGGQPGDCAVREPNSAVGWPCRRSFRHHPSHSVVS